MLDFIYLFLITATFVNLFISIIFYLMVMESEMLRKEFDLTISKRHLLYAGICLVPVFLIRIFI